MSEILQANCSGSKTSGETDSPLHGLHVNSMLSLGQRHINITIGPKRGQKGCRKI